MELPLAPATPDQLPKDPGIGAGGIKEPGLRSGDDQAVIASSFRRQRQDDDLVLLEQGYEDPLTLGVEPNVGGGIECRS